MTQLWVEPMRPHDSGAVGYGYLDWVESVNGFHPGIDLNHPNDLGQDVYAASDGAVVYSKDAGGGWGNLIVIEHFLGPGEYVWTRYAHLHRRYVAVGRVVKAGEVIGEVGATGTVGPHLHFEVMVSRPPTWTAYTSGKPKGWVAQRWADPLAFIADRQQSPIIDEEEYMALLIQKEGGKAVIVKDGTAEYPLTGGVGAKGLRKLVDAKVVPPFIFVVSDSGNVLELKEL